MREDDYEPVQYLWVMRFDDGHIEQQWAPSQSDAVRRRIGAPYSLYPHTINNLTILDWWRDRIRENKHHG